MTTTEFIAWMAAAVFAPDFMIRREDPCPKDSGKQANTET